MKTKRLFTLLCATLVVLIVVVIPLMATCAPAPGPIVLKMVGFKMKDGLLEDTNVGMLMDEVRKGSKGELAIEFVGGPDVMTPFDQAMAVKRGVFQMAVVPASFYIPLVPGAEMMVASSISPDEERKVGVYDLLLEMHVKAGLFYLGKASSAKVPEMMIFLNKPIKTPGDLKGLRIGGMAPGPAPAIAALGAVFSVVPVPDQYIAIEKGIVNGLFTSRVTFVELKLQEVAKATIDHPFFMGMALTIVNLDAWNKLPKHLQDVLIEAQKASEIKWADEHARLQAKLDQTMKDARVQFVKFSPPDAAWYLDTIYNGFWDAQKKKYPEVGPKFMELLKKK
jgi:TRAP-type C4-dicarboxylate transport system substrate-binding protein